DRELPHRGWQDHGAAQGREPDRQRSRRPASGRHAGQRLPAVGRHLDLRQGRPVGPGRGRHAHRQDRQHHRWRNPGRLAPDQGMTMRDTIPELKDLAAKACELARKAGADAAEVTCRDGLELSVKVRLGETEFLQEAGSRGLGLRVLVGSRQAVTHTSDLRPAELARFVADSVALARLAEPDEMSKPADPADLATSVPDLDLYDPAVEGLDAVWALEQARIAEKASQDHDPRITNSEGASVDRVVGGFAFANSGGFVGGYRGSYVSLAVEPLAEDEGGKKRKGFWWTGDRFVAGLEDSAETGREAARRTLDQL